MQQSIQMYLTRAAQDSILSIVTISKRFRQKIVLLPLLSKADLFPLIDVIAQLIVL